eukprot:3286624-Prorocentrum_lima.AAC.1
MDPVLMYVEITIPDDDNPRHVRFGCLQQEAPEGLLLRAVAVECKWPHRTFWVSRGRLPPL